VAGAAAVAGFLVWQHPADEAASVALAPAVTEEPTPTVTVAQVLPEPVVLPVEMSAPEPAAPRLESSNTSKPRFVVHEFVAASTPSRSFVSVTSPNTFSSPAYDASVQMVNTLTMGTGFRAGSATEAGRF